MFDRVFRRATTTMSFSLPISLIEDLERLLPYEVGYRNRSDFATKVFTDYVNKRKKELGWSGENGT